MWARKLMIMTRVFWPMTLILFAFSVIGCEQTVRQPPKLNFLRVGVLPGENKEELTKRVSPLLEHMEQVLGIQCELVLQDSYSELQAAFERGDVDLAWLGGYTFVNVNRSRNAYPLVSRDRDLRFTSYYLVRVDDGGKELEAFRGKRLAFGSPLSTSGHLMPRYFMSEKGVVPEEFFGGITYTGAHDLTAIAVQEGRADIGVASGPVVDAMYSSGQLDRGKVRVLEETPPYLDYVWTCQESIPAETRNQIRDVFLGLSKSNPEHAKVLAGMRAEHFLPVHSEDFDLLREIIDQVQPAEIPQ